MLNRATIIGNIGKDIELRHTSSGQAVAQIRIATSRTWTDRDTRARKEETEWHDVEVWGKTAQACADYLKKGSRVYVEGRLKTESWGNRPSIDVLT